MVMSSLPSSPVKSNFCPKLPQAERPPVQNTVTSGRLDREKT